MIENPKINEIHGFSDACFSNKNLHEPKPTCSAGAGGAALAAPVAEPGITWAMDPLV